MLTCVVIATVVAVVVALLVAARWVVYPVSKNRALIVSSAWRGRSARTSGAVLVLPLVETVSTEVRCCRW